MSRAPGSPLSRETVWKIIFPLSQGREGTNGTNGGRGCRGQEQMHSGGGSRPRDRLGRAREGPALAGPPKAQDPQKRSSYPRSSGVGERLSFELGMKKEGTKAISTPPLKGREPSGQMGLSLGAQAPHCCPRARSLNGGLLPGSQAGARGQTARRGKQSRRGEPGDGQEKARPAVS